DVLRREFLVDRAEAGVRRLCFLFELLQLRPAEDTVEAAEARIEHQIAERERDRDVEQPRPPARQGIIVFGEVFIPDVPGGVGLDRLAHALDLEEYRAGDDRNEANQTDINIPEPARELAHRSSSSSGSRPSRSKRSLRAGPY